MSGQRSESPLPPKSATAEPALRQWPDDWERAARLWAHAYERVECRKPDPHGPPDHVRWAIVSGLEAGRADTAPRFELQGVTVRLQVDVNVRQAAAAFVRQFMTMGRDAAEQSLCHLLTSTLREEKTRREESEAKVRRLELKLSRLRSEIGGDDDES